MKLTVAYDEVGQIVTAVQGGPEVEDRPVAGLGTSIGEFEVPEELARRPLEEIVGLSHVDVRANQLVEGPVGGSVERYEL
jgi:hypothetical protein